MPRSTPRKPLFVWSPRPLIESAAEQPLDNFLASVPELLLVVRLNDFSSELADGLAGNDASTYRGRPRRLNTISVAWSVPEEQTEMTTPPSMRPAPIRKEPPKSEFEYATELLSLECYVARIRKRSADQPQNQVTVGRSPAQDITLQHPSVSREHAVFNTANGLTLVDAGSRNHTFVNGELVRGLVRVKPGDALKFGAVRCNVCSASGLWHAVRG